MGETARGERGRRLAPCIRPGSSPRTHPAVAMGLFTLIHDRWSPGAFKPEAMEGRGPLGDVAPMWVDDTHRRRLRFYGLCRALLDNNAHEYLATATDEQKRNRRQYGDPDLLVERIVGGLLGDSMQIVVDGADADLPDTPVLPDPPDDPGTDAGPIDRRLFDARRQVWETNAAEAIDAWIAAHAGLPALRERQQWLRDWADAELFDAKVYENERDGAVPLGDGLMAFAIDRNTGRVVVDVYDPGWYFPVLEVNQRGYPTKVHIAWEFEETNGAGEVEKFIERLTWELVDLADIGLPARRYPWQTAGEAPSTRTCVFTDAVWRWDALGERKVSDLTAPTFVRDNSEGRPFDRLDLGFDFIPVLHVPCTPSTRDHYGRSILARVMQLFDDIADADTDLHEAGKYAAGPMLAGNRAAPDGQVQVRPGSWVNLGEGGRMDVLNLAESLAPLQGMIEFLLERLSVNSQVSAEILGRVEEGDAISGIRTMLKFGPFEQLVQVLRMVREDKYAIGLRMVARMSQVAGWLPPGENPTARLAFGSFLPSDTTMMVELVVKLLDAHGISRRTALRMLVDAGVDIGDIGEELARIESEDFEAAVALSDATGDESFAVRRLGLTQTDDVLPEPPPAITLPGGE